MSLPAALRLRLTRHVIAHMRKIGLSVHSKHTTLLYVKSSDGKNSKLAVVVGTRISKKATERNRLRRLIQEVAREQLIKMQTSYDMIVYPKATLLDKKLEEIAKEMNFVFEKLT
jgi:ribonuclease P protein component